jgi:hypothetical protein
MKTGSQPQRVSALAAFIKYFAAMMALVYVAAGVVLLLQSNRLFNMPYHYSMTVGSMLIFYGTFRGYRVYRKYFRAQHESDD